jgi:signal transduction histidine kinase
VIPEDLKIVIFRILQEATNNAAKHSRAKRLDVGLEIEEGALRLMVMDDGVGFQPPAGPDGGSPLGLGLSSMRERAELSGGTFRLRTAAGRGTTVEVAWPLPPGDVSGETSPS